jgi:hypothetical protein
VIKRAPLELPPEVASEFVKDMRAYFAAETRHARDEIVARQLHALREYQDGIKLHHVRDMFVQMQDHLGG